MTDVAAEASLNLAQLSPAQRSAEVIRIGALNETARALRASGPERGEVFKAQLLGSTAMGGAALPCRAPDGDDSA
jgi:hypothetical protein